MRITGIIRSIGDHDICENYPQEFHDDLNFDAVKGIVITCGDDTLRSASNLLCATVDIYPHPVDGLQPGECTPENYAHALARLAHAEDHLAREVRSSQAAHDIIRRLEATAKERAASDAEEARRSELAADAKSAAWIKYLDLRKQIRRAAEEKRPDADVHALVNEALTLAHAHDLDPTTLELEEARRTIDERERTITNMQGTINELVRQNDDLEVLVALRG